MSEEHIKSVFKGHVLDYILENMQKAIDGGGGRDYSTFASSLFER